MLLASENGCMMKVIVNFVIGNFVSPISETAFEVGGYFSVGRRLLEKILQELLTSQVQASGAWGWSYSGYFSSMAQPFTQKDLGSTSSSV